MIEIVSSKGNRYWFDDQKTKFRYFMASSLETGSPWIELTELEVQGPDGDAMVPGAVVGMQPGINDRGHTTFRIHSVREVE